VNRTIVLIPHFNNPEGLYNSVRSLSNSSNIDLLIVDDGSTVHFQESIIKQHFLANGNCRFIRFEKNKGIEEALNQGLKYAMQYNYTYVARLDCGDLCAHNRFDLQENFLDTHPDHAIVGSAVKFFSIDRKIEYYIKHPLKHEVIIKKLYLNCMLVHPSIMIRVAALNTIGLYPTKYKAAEEYALFFKTIKHYKIANIEDVLVECELNPNGISATRRKRQVLSRIQIVWDNFYFGFYPIYGLLRNCILYFMPYALLNTIKKYVLKK
jgi:glycosyltransferase involved in cell wall biosynthesis